MQIKATVKQIVVKDGKEHDVQFAFKGISDEDVIRLLRWRGNDLVLQIDPAAEQLGMGLDASGIKDPFANPETFTIDGEKYPILTGEMDLEYRLTGRELRDLVRLEREEPLYELRPGPDDSWVPIIIAPFEVVAITPSTRFVTTLLAAELETRAAVEETAEVPA